MISWGTVTVGGISFNEDWSAEESDGGQITVAGSPTPTDSAAAARAMHRSVLGLSEQPFVPVTFSDKTSLSGFYRVDSASSTLFQQPGGPPATATWKLSLTRLGSERDVEFESRVPTIARASEIAGTASFWHAPPVAFDDYFTGATVPNSSVTRTGSDGPVTVFRGIPVDVAPRWTVGVGDYLKGSARVSFDGVRHVGTDTPPHTAWSVSNSLVEVRSTTGAAFEVSVVAADGTVKSVTGWAPSVDGTFPTAHPEFTVLRNDPEEVTVRLSYPTSAGRMTIDLGLRRGSRFVTGVIKRHSSAQLGIVSTTAGAGSTVVTGGLRATNADADGNRYVIGSSRTIATNTAAAWIIKGSVTRLDFFVGHEVGSTPAAGDAFADLFAQYLGSTSERVKAMRR